MAGPKKKKDEAEGKPRLELIYSDDTQFKYWNSSLFNDLYLRKDVPTKYEDLWTDDDSDPFQRFLKRIKDLSTTYDGREKELKKWSETENISNWIKPVLDALGWGEKSTRLEGTYLEETTFNYRGSQKRTDILIVDDPSEKKQIKDKSGNKRLDEARRSVLIPVEAKTWCLLEKNRKDKDVETSDANEQIVSYMDMLNKNWGILTDGCYWRLFSKELSTEDSSRYFEFNLGALIRSIQTEETDHDRKEVIESAKYFFHFFGKQSHFPSDLSEEPFVDKILNYSKKYARKVEDDLKGRFVKAMNIICNAFHDLTDDHTEEHRNVIRSVSESTLFNILFVKALESRNVLPMSTSDYRPVSLSSIIDKIETFDPKRNDNVNARDLAKAFKKGNGNSFKYAPDGFEIHDRIVRLTRIIHDGRSSKDDFGFEIAGFRESVYSNSEWRYFRECKLPNAVWVKVLFELGYAESTIRGRDYQQVPYSYFTPRQLGSIYESFLEFKLDLADADMVYEGQAWVKKNLDTPKYKEKDIPKVRKGSLFFTPNNKERKATGSYYTPHYIVSEIVERTLAPLTNKKSQDELLELAVCDPAMGSGHFLVSCLNKIARSYVHAMEKKSDEDTRYSFSEIKRRVLDSCIFGVDVNPRAVKLTKLALWLETAHINYKLERLDDQLFCSNSLMPVKKSKPFTHIYTNKTYSKFDDMLLDAKFENSDDIYDVPNRMPLDLSELPKFDAVVGNPPYKGFNLIGGAEKQALKYFFPNVYNLKADYYYYFFPLFTELLREGGKMGIITMRNFLEARFAEKTRKYLEQNLSGEIYDYANLPIYPEIGADFAIEYLEKTPGKIKHLKTSFNGTDDHEKNFFDSLETFSDSAAEETNSVGLADYLELSEVANCETGVQSGAVKVYIIKRDHKKLEKFKEEGFLYPCVRNKSIKNGHFSNRFEHFMFYC